MVVEVMGKWLVSPLIGHAQEHYLILSDQSKVNIWGKWLPRWNFPEDPSHLYPHPEGTSQSRAVASQFSPLLRNAVPFFESPFSSQAFSLPGLLARIYLPSAGP